MAVAVAGAGAVAVAVAALGVEKELRVARLPLSAGNHRDGSATGTHGVGVRGGSVASSP